MVQQSILDIKGGKHKTAQGREALLSRLIAVASSLRQRGARVILTACTELPVLLQQKTVAAHPVLCDCELVDPLRVLADEIISITTASRVH